MPPEDGELRNKFLAEIGRLVVAYSNAENALSVIFVELGKIPLEDRVKQFHARSSFAEKLAITDAAVLEAKSDQQWKRLSECLIRYRKVRNAVAHNQMVPDVENKRRVYVLRNPTFTPHRDEDSLRIEHISEAAAAIEEVVAELWTFRGTLGHLGRTGHR
ncbi:MAG: hypothetical protein IT365_19680 [Candidatus Hydrogenedentes bacterium]|nr:hypothetical protein [Candidatus Hydrogenedentota bacterium]